MDIFMENYLVFLSLNFCFVFKLKIDYSEVPIKSVELQLVRVETCGCAEGYARDGNLWIILFKYYIVNLH